MATTTQLKPKQIQRLKQFGITAVTAEKATVKLVEFLESKEVTDLDDDLGVDDLIDMAELFNDDDEVIDDESEEVEEVEEEEEEAPKKPVKKTAPKVAVVEEEEEEDDELEDDEEFEEEEEEVEAPPKKATVAIKKKSAPARETEDELDELAQEVKKTKPVGGKATNTVQKKLAENIFDARNKKDHMEYLEFLHDHFPLKKFQYDILKQGFTIRALGKNSKVTVMNFDELKLVDGELLGNLYLNRFKSVEELTELLPDEYQEHEIGMFRGESHPCIKKVTSTDVLTIMESDVYKETIKRSSSTDTKMGANRQALEESLENKTTAPKKTAIVTTIKKK